MLLQYTRREATEPNGMGLFIYTWGIIILNPHALAVSSSTLPIASGSNTDNGNVVKFLKLSQIRWVNAFLLVEKK